VISYGHNGYRLGRRTVAVVVQVRELVAPLRENAKSIFEERDNDEKASNSR
jgi:hypothetical protein